MIKKHSFNSISTGSNIFLNILSALFAITCVYPLLLLISISFTDEQALKVSGFKLIPSKFSSYAYQYILDYSASVGIGNSYFWTIVVTAVGTLISLLVVSLAAYPLSRVSLKYRYPITFVMFFSMMFSGGLIPSYIINTKYLHLSNTLWALVLPGAVNVGQIILMRTFFTANVPESLIESARIDGCGELRAFFKIALPISGPVFATIALFDVIAYWNEWFSAMLYINDNKIVPLQLLLMRIQNNMTFITESVGLTPEQKEQLLERLPTETARMAMVVLAIGPIVLAYPYFQKYFVKGITVGSIKG